MLRKIKKYNVFEIFGFFLYRVFFRYLPIDNNKVFFESYWGKSYSCNPKYISEYLENNYPKMKIVWSLSKPTEKNGHYKRFSLRYYYHLATSKYFILNVNLPNFFINRDGMVHVQTKHGTPLKLMGIDELKFRKLDVDIPSLEHRSSRWNFVISSNKYSSYVWKKSFPFNYELLEIGYPRNDVLINNNNEKYIGTIKNKLKIPNNKKVVLYMPTIRDYIYTTNPYIELDKLVNDLNDEYIFLMRSHYLENINNNFNDKVYDVTQYPVIEELYLISDILITDYSSAMFDFSLLNRSTILYLSDYDEYTQNRGVYFDIKEKPPGCIVNNYEQLLITLKNEVYLDDKYRHCHDEFRKKFASMDIGLASKELCQKVFGKE